MWNILSFVAYLKENSPFLKKLKEFTNFCVFISRGLSHCALAIYIKKYLNAKQELWTLKYFTMQKF
jgi:hypothetical protein